MVAVAKKNQFRFSIPIPGISIPIPFSIPPISIPIPIPELELELNCNSNSGIELTPNLVDENEAIVRESWDCADRLDKSRLLCTEEIQYIVISSGFVLQVD